MKALLGLFILITSTPLFAESKVLILRGRVPASYRVEVAPQKLDQHRPQLRVVTNETATKGGPRLSVQRSEDRYLVSLTHP